MIRSFKFLLQFAWINLASILGFAAVVLAGAYATGVPNGAENLFRTYFGGFPLMELIIVFILAFALCTTNLNLGLSFGARRRDFFWAIQGLLVLYTAVCWGIQLALSAIPDTAGWTSVDHWTILMSLGGQPAWVFPLICLTLLALGCLCGLIYVRSRALGALVMIMTILAGVGAAILLMVAADFGTVGLWGSLSRLLAAGAAAVFLICEVLIRRIVNRSVVR